MKRLTLIRHAKSSWDDASLPDFDRPLGQRGLRDAPRIGAHLARSAPLPEKIISSPALRAIATARLVAPEIAYPEDRIELEPRLYAASLQQLLDVLHGFEDNAQQIMIFGHNPGLERLARYLDPSFVGDGAKFPTCGVARMELAASHWKQVTNGCAQKTEFIYPKTL
mgnify:CR=1 FL=1